MQGGPRGRSVVVWAEIRTADEYKFSLGRSFGHSLPFLPHPTPLHTHTKGLAATQTLEGVFVCRGKRNRKRWSVYPYRNVSAGHQRRCFDWRVQHCVTILG